MKDYLTIGQVSKLLDISTHQIRHYEKCGFITPIINETNGYHLYGQNEIFRLIHSLFLRRFDISISDIKEAFNTYEKDDYLNLFEKKIDELEQRINSLKELKSDTKTLCANIHEFIDNQNKFVIYNSQDRYLKVIKRLSYKQDLSLTEYYECAKDIKKIHEMDFTLVFEKKEILLCVPKQKESDNTISLTSGEYIKYAFLVDKESDIDDAYELFEKHLKVNKIKTDGVVYLKDYSLVSIAYNDHICYEIESKITSRH